MLEKPSTAAISQKERARRSRAPERVQMARALLVVVALALGGAALTPPPAPKTPVTGRQAVVKERKQLLPPTVAPLVVETVPDGPLLADAPPLLDEGGDTPTLATTTIPPIPDELEDAVRKRSAEEQAEKAKQQVKIARSKKKGRIATKSTQFITPSRNDRFDGAVAKRSSSSSVKQTTAMTSVMNHVCSHVAQLSSVTKPCATSHR